jgi:DNA-binding NtrC family response regulator
MIFNYAQTYDVIAAERLIGASAAMREVMEQVRRASFEALNVLVCGEPGTGRELIARKIHEHAHPAADKPFVKVDCSKACSPDPETALFGCAGSRADVRTFERVTRGSRIYQSLGGTLFLRNVGDLPARVQVRLSRVLRDGEVLTVEDDATTDIDLRVITAGEAAVATNEDGGIRPDLHRRLATLRVDVPPLRDRREDIPELASHLLVKVCARANVPCKQFSEPAQSMLSALPWRRGNGTELCSLLENLVLRVSGTTIGLDDVLAHVQLDGHAAWFPVGFSLRDARARFESDYIDAVLAQHHGRIPDAARTLGIQRSNLYRKLRRLNVRPKPKH